MIRIEYYSTNVGNFFRVASGNSYYGSNTLSSKRIVEINGADVRNLPLLSGWYHLDCELKNFRVSKPSTQKQVGWKLKNPEIASEKIPAMLSMDDLTQHLDDDGDLEHAGKYASIASLYSPEVMTLPEEIEPIEVELVKLRDLEVENYNAPTAMKFQYRDGNYSDPIREGDLSAVAVFSDIERMLTPEFLLHTRPCTLTSQQVYKIVRAHIQNNIDGKVARITSNYDFCFEVQRVVQHKPVEIKREKLTASLKSYRPPRFTTSVSTNKLVKLFSMTWAGAGKSTKGYGDYPIIDGWKADSLQELYDNMQQYLSDLMQEINKPAVECSHCNGTGQVTKTVETNARKESL
jgi:hypothetical protein